MTFPVLFTVTWLQLLEWNLAVFSPQAAWLHWECPGVPPWEVRKNIFKMAIFWGYLLIPWRVSKTKSQELYLVCLKNLFSNIWNGSDVEFREITGNFPSKKLGPDDCETHLDIRNAGKKSAAPSPHRFDQLLQCLEVWSKTPVFTHKATDGSLLSDQLDWVPTRRSHYPSCRDVAIEVPMKARRSRKKYDMPNGHVSVEILTLVGIRINLPVSHPFLSLELPSVCSEKNYPYQPWPRYWHFCFTSSNGWRRKGRSSPNVVPSLTSWVMQERDTLWYSKIPPFSKLDHQSPLTQIDAELAASNSNAFE